MTVEADAQRQGETNIKGLLPIFAIVAVDGLVANIFGARNYPLSVLVFMLC